MSPQVATRSAADADGALILERHQDLDAIRDEWIELAERCGNPFATWEWAATWWEHFGHGRPLHVTVCRRPDGTVAAILPLYLAARGPLRLLRFVGHGTGDILGPICAPDDAALAASALQEAIADVDRPWDVLLAERMPSDRFGGLIPGRVVQREAHPLVRTRGASWEEFLASRSSNQRREFRAKRRRLERDHEARFRLTHDRDRLRQDFDALVRLHHARWGEAAAFRGRRERFHREFAERAFERGWLRLWSVEVDGRVVAARYGFRFAKVDWAFISGRDPDPAWDRYSLGLALLVRAVQATFDDGMSAFSFLRGDEAYKQRFAADDVGLESVAVARSPRGVAAVSAARAAKRMPPRIRHRVVRSLG
jgi:CelD/BcsL family acetyltransferase involved in cellulose biosynthesis